MKKRDEFSFFQEFRVRYSEIDSQGVVFNSHYMTYFDSAITEYIRSLNYSYVQLVQERGIDFHLVKTTTEFHKPVFFDEIIEVGVALSKIGNTSLTWSLAIFKKDNDQCLTSGELIWVCTLLGTNKSYPLPEDLIELLKKKS